MPTLKGILSFPTLFQPRAVRDAQGNPTGVAKYSATLLIPPNDPQLPALQAEVEQAKANTFPSGWPTKADSCLAPYDTKYAGKDYYDPKFSGWFVFSCSAKQDDKPAVVDMSHQPIIDAGEVCSGAVVWLNAGISGYTKGTGGVGGWLNGVMATGEIGEFGRLDGKPSVDQMFANVGGGAAVEAPPAPPVPAAPPSVPTPPAPVQFPPEGWIAHPSAPGHFYCGQEVMSEQDLRAKFNIVQPSFA